MSKQKKDEKNLILFCFEPKPRFELGTPSLRVKCSTAELIQQTNTMIRCANIVNFSLFAQIITKFLLHSLQLFVNSHCKPRFFNNRTNIAIT